MKDVNILKNNGIDVDKGIELLGDIDMYDTIMEEYYNNFENRMRQLDFYKNSSDMANYAIEVHSLKSDSRYLGITLLGDMAYEQEMASKANDLSKVTFGYPNLVNEGNRVIGVIKKYLGLDESSVVIPKVEDVVVISPEQVNRSTQAILVADDSSIIRDFVKEIFSSQYDVLMASDGQEVINIVNSNPNITALLLDLNMPNVDGFQVLEYFKTNNLFGKIPVSVISGASDKDSIDKAFSYNIVDMLNKPFNMDNVKLVVEKTISMKNM